VNELVERYFGSFLDEILRHGGDVNETAGDGLMVIFRDDEPQRHARAAVQTAAAILRRAQQINAELAPAFEPIRLHVGVNSGIAAVGATKIEGGAGTRWVYTASGPVTNLAARLAALGEGDVIFIGAETRGRLEEGWMVEDLGERVLRNVEEPVRVFQLAVTLEVPAAPSLLARS
jgi:class 3 adenylate cyclase